MRKTSLRKLLPFYEDIFVNWKTYFSSSPETPACFLSQFLLFNKYIQIEDNPAYLTKFAAKNTFLCQLFEEGNWKPLDKLKLEYNLTKETYFQWLQLKHAAPHNWKTNIKQNPRNASNFLIQDHHLTKGARLLTFEKLSFKELYSILITKFTNKPSNVSNVYFEKIFPNINSIIRIIII